MCVIVNYCDYVLITTPFFIIAKIWMMSSVVLTYMNPPFWKLEPMIGVGSTLIGGTGPNTGFNVAAGCF